MSDNDSEALLPADRLDRIEQLLESNIQVTQSNAKAIQALSETVASHSGDIEALKQLVESNARSNQALADTVADANRQLSEQLAEHSARTTSAISELSQIVGTMARIFHDHIHDDQRHNPL